MKTGAVFSPCGLYRYRLWREWDASKPVAVFCMLNPSTADEVQNDPTVERCQRRAVAMGFGRLEVVNVFAFRSTDPGALYVQADPVGPDNDRAIIDAVSGAGLVVCAWGKHAALNGRGEQVQRLMHSAGVEPHALKINKDGSPGHPLYIGYDVQPVPFRLEVEA